MPGPPKPIGGPGMTDLPIPTHTTSLFVHQGAQTVLEWGSTERASYLASVRKSLLSLLYGIAVSREEIDLDATVDDFGITDIGGLLPIERTARVRDLLTCRSGVYHPPSSPGSHEEAFPERGSHEPGTFFVYNNWDVNTAGAILAKATGRSVAENLEIELARPLGFRDFAIDRQLLVGDPRRSLIPAFHFILSARDLAKVGLLMLGGGRWGDRQIVPHDWIQESLNVHVRREQMPDDTGFGTCDYGYLWWLTREEAHGWEDAFMAIGNFGQFLLVLPELEAVIVLRREVTDSFAIARNSGVSVPTSDVPGSVTFDEFMALAHVLVDRMVTEKPLG